MRKKTECPFAQNLKTVLSDRGITQKAASELAGVTPTTLNDWLSGTQPSDPLAVQKLARALGCEFEWLLTGSSSSLDLAKLSLSELFDVVDEPSFSGLFQIEAKRLKRR